MIINTLDTGGSVITVELNVFGNVFSGISVELELTEKLSTQDVKKVKISLTQSCNGQFVYLNKGSILKELESSFLNDFNVSEKLTESFTVRIISSLISTSYTPTMNDK